MSLFLAVLPATWVASNDLAFAIRDAFPVSPGHTLVITRRVVPDWFSATADERAAVMALVEHVKAERDHAEPRPDGYNVGFNAGEAAGQTVMHLHVHVIPRYRGDVLDPRGGVRHVIPSKGNYLAPPSAEHALATGGTADPFARHIIPLFDRATDVAIVAAFVQEGGVRRIDDALRRAMARGAHVRLVTGDYLEITQARALEQLLDWQQASAARGANEVEGDDDEAVPAWRGTFEARIVEVSTLPPPTRSFHPKSWRFEGDGFSVAFVGSSNLSHAALETGVEWNLRVDRHHDARAYAHITEAFEALWGRAKVLDAEWIERYAERAKLAVAAPLAGEVELEPLETPCVYRAERPRRRSRVASFSSRCPARRLEPSSRSRGSRIATAVSCSRRTVRRAPRSSRHRTWCRSPASSRASVRRILRPRSETRLLRRTLPQRLASKTSCRRRAASRGISSCSSTYVAPSLLPIASVRR